MRVLCCAWQILLSTSYSDNMCSNHILLHSTPLQPIITLHLSKPLLPSARPFDLTDTQMMLTWGLSECLCAPLAFCGCTKAICAGRNTLVALHSRG